MKPWRHPLRAWNAFVQRWACTRVDRDDAARRHAADARMFTNMMDQLLLAAHQMQHGTWQREAVEINAYRAGEMGLYYHHMAGGDAETAEQHRQYAMRASDAVGATQPACLGRAA